MDERIQSVERRAIEATGKSFLADMLSEQWPRAHALLSEETRSELSAADFGTLVRGAFHPMGPFTELQVQNTFLPRVTGAPPRNVICGESISRWFSVAFKADQEQAHVLLTASTRNNQWTFSLWLFKIDSRWQVHAFHGGISSLADKSAENLQEMARAEKAKSNDLNAFLFYNSALQLAYRGPNLQWALHSELLQEMAGLPVPEDLKGAPPFQWSAPGRKFEVSNVGPLAVGGKIYLHINHQTEPWKDNEQVEQWNQQLIRYIEDQFPEYKSAFSGLIVRAHERGGSKGYGSVVELEEKQPTQKGKP